MIAAFIEIGLLVLVWLAVIVLGSQWGRDDKPAADDGPAFVAPDPDKTITLAAVADWYQLWYEATATDRLLERAAKSLGAAELAA